METPGVFFVVGNRRICPKCVEGMICREEVKFPDAAGYNIYPVEPGMGCVECDQPMARKECVSAFENFMGAIYAWLKADAPPLAGETPAEDDRIAKAKEEVRRAKAGVCAAYQNLVKARNEIIAVGGASEHSVRCTATASKGLIAGKVI